MALILEDGSIVANAASFVSVAEITAYAVERGVTVSATASDVEILARKAMDWLISKESTLAGVRVDNAQTLPYPRTGVTVHGFEVLSTEIPALIKEVQMQAATDAHSVDLLPTHAATPEGKIKVDKLDVIETEFFRPGSGDFTPILTKLDDLLKPLQTGRGLGLNVFRG